MNKRSSAPARIVAVATLVVAFIVAVVVISGALGGGGSDGSGTHKRGSHSAHRSESAGRDVPATYVVQSGDTLIAISHRLGVPVARIQRLNPEVDPQILIAGEKLKLK